MRRFAIRTLMGVVLLLALALTSLVDPLRIFWPSLVFTLVIIVLAIATLGSILGRGPAWKGFCVFGWICMALAFGPWGPHATPIPMPLTTIALSKFSTWLYREPWLPPHAVMQRFDEPLALQMRGSSGLIEIPIALLQTGNSVLSLCAGWVGSLVATGFLRKKSST
jgi:hypothetical protein